MSINVFVWNVFYFYEFCEVYYGLLLSEIFLDKLYRVFSEWNVWLILVALFCEQTKFYLTFFRSLETFDCYTLDEIPLEWWIIWPVNKRQTSTNEPNIFVCSLRLSQLLSHICNTIRRIESRHTDLWIKC